MAVEIWNEGGIKWQELIARLLRRKYGNDYQEIPDKDDGDCGLECYTLSDYTVYQCYATDEPVSTRELYEKQRDKITRDIKKFVDNRSKLENIFRHLKVKKWMLVVPRFESHKLLEHASKKTKEVKEAKLSYVADDFMIVICTAEQWELERKQLISCDLAYLDIEDKHEGPIKLGNPMLLSNLKRKLAKLEMNEGQIARMEKKMLQYYLDCEAKLSVLNEQYPEYLEKYNKKKSDKENYLETQSMLFEGTNAQLLNQTLEGFKNILSEELKGVSPATINALSYGTLSSWLIECPLDFE